MNRMSTSRVGKGPVTPTPHRNAHAPIVTGKGSVKKSGSHGKVRIPKSLG